MRCCSISTKSYYLASACSRTMYIQLDLTFRRKFLCASVIVIMRMNIAKCCMKCCCPKFAFLYERKRCGSTDYPPANEMAVPLRPNVTLFDNLLQGFTEMVEIMSKFLWIVKSSKRAEGGLNWQFVRFLAYASGVRLGSRRDNVTTIGLLP